MSHMASLKASTSCSARMMRSASRNGLAIRAMATRETGAVTRKFEKEKNEVLPRAPQFSCWVTVRPTRSPRSQ
ncbi:hypothetical protein D9M69_633460 [compost metagenome]